MVVSILRVLQDTNPLEIMRALMVKIRENNPTYTLHLKKHYRDGSIVGIIEMDDAFEIIQYQYTTDTIRYIHNTNRIYSILSEYIRHKSLFTGPLLYTDYDTLDHYGLDSDVSF